MTIEAAIQDAVRKAIADELLPEINKMIMAYSAPVPLQQQEPIFIDHSQGNPCLQTGEELRDCEAVREVLSYHAPHGRYSL